MRVNAENGGEPRRTTERRQALMFSFSAILRGSPPFSALRLLPPCPAPACLGTANTITLRRTAGQSLESGATQHGDGNRCACKPASQFFQHGGTKGGPRSKGFDALRAKRNCYSAPWFSVALHSS